VAYVNTKQSVAQRCRHEHVFFSACIRDLTDNLKKRKSIAVYQEHNLSHPTTNEIYRSCHPPTSFIPLYVPLIFTLSHLKSATCFFAFSTFNAAEPTACSASLIASSLSE
jgi:hypothetical protein